MCITASLFGSASLSLKERKTVVEYCYGFMITLVVHVTQLMLLQAPIRSFTCLIKKFRHL